MTTGSPQVGLMAALSGTGAQSPIAMASRSPRRRNENHFLRRIVSYRTARARSNGVEEFRERSSPYGSIRILLRTKCSGAFRTNKMSTGSKLDRAGTLLIAEEVAALTGLSVDTLAQWRSQR